MCRLQTETMNLNVLKKVSFPDFREFLRVYENFKELKRIWNKVDDLVGGIPARGRGFGTRYSLKFPATNPFCDSMIVHHCQNLDNVVQNSALTQIFFHNMDLHKQIITEQSYFFFVHFVFDNLWI